MAEFPALPLFTDAILADCNHLSDDEFGLYMRILITMWRSPECRIPSKPEWLEKRFRIAMEKVIPILSEFCVTDGNFYSQKRLTKEFIWVKKNSKRQRERIAKRWSVSNNELKTKETDLYRSDTTVCNTPHPTLLRKKERKSPPLVPPSGGSQSERKTHGRRKTKSQLAREAAQRGIAEIESAFEPKP